MFEITGNHTVAINHEEFTARLEDDLLERMASFHSGHAVGPGSFSGNSAAAVIDGYDVRLWIVGIAFPHQGYVTDGVATVVTQVDDAHIRFEVDIVETDKGGGFAFYANSESFQRDVRFK